MNVFRRAVLALSLFTIAWYSVPAVAQDAEKFESAAARLSLTKPAGWSFVSHEGETHLSLSAEELRQVDEELAKKFEHLSVPVPLVTMSRTSGASEGVVFVLVAPMAANTSPRKVQEAAFAQTKKLFPNIVLDMPIREIEVSGRPGAEYAASYTLRVNDTLIPTKTRSIVVPRGKAVFLIGLVVTSPGNDDRFVEDFAKVVSSIAIRD